MRREKKKLGDAWRKRGGKLEGRVRGVLKGARYSKSQNPYFQRFFKITLHEGHDQ